MDPVQKSDVKIKAACVECEKGLKRHGSVSQVNEMTELMNLE